MFTGDVFKDLRSKDKDLGLRTRSRTCDPRTRT